MGLCELTVDFDLVTISDSKVREYQIIFGYQRKKSWRIIVSNLLDFCSLSNLVPGSYQASCVMTS